MQGNIKSLLSVIFLTAACHAATSTTAYHYQVPNAKLILSIVASSSDAQVMIISTDQDDSEELTSGTPAILNMSLSKIASYPKLQSLQVDSNIVWTQDGRHAFFETAQGIFEVDTAHPDESPKAIVAGMTHGVALSRDESKLAYWKSEKSAFQLIVKDIKTSTVLKRWTLPFLYGGEATGFEISFQDATTIYARTFDSEVHTPLKSFNVNSGKMETLEKDCIGLARSADATYYFANSGHGPVLKKVSGGGVATISPSVNGYNSLIGSGSGRWLALSGRGRSAIFDSIADHIVVKSTCESMAALPDGTPLYVHYNKVSSDAAVCGRLR